ncbi:hypothetical protein BOTBODRAFT_38661 [Botryobasidium botryosum FD-172 SS1]|uniref:Protein kinase domain-containing protein n=1 Tax=Botryobasidium botryosum (strain FD-172 SS1) TaxID=930990 RepID=A0A067LYW8_BOTB1|nr:hypothetical protein BOTBODRAFT_38661 [Botryobasidium botryosum FD-172 SS1]
MDADTPEDTFTEEHRRLADADPFELNPSEVFWVAHQPFLESRGYQLRPRYRPGWVKSWKRTPGFNVEDAISPVMPAFRVMDATRMSDGRVVILKRIKKALYETEIEISHYLSQEAFLSDPRNHCAPLLDILYPEASEIAFLVLPLLRHFKNPKMQSRQDAVDFVGQTLEGLVFMHEKGVAHRDCALYNIMMDPKDLYPEGYHPQRDFLTLDATRYAPVRRRHQVPFPRYYFIDFGISVRFRDGEPPIASGTDGQDRTVPELQPKQDPTEPVEYNAFLLDVYILGNLYKNELLMKYRGLAFLVPLIDRMTAKVPAQRPSAAEALELLQACRKRLLPLGIYRPIIPVKDGIAIRVAREAWYWGQRVTTIRRSA